MKPILRVLLIAVLITTLATPAFAQQYDCVGDRVIDPERWLDEGVARDFDTESHNLDRFGIRLYLFSAHTDDVIAGNYVGDLARELIIQGACGMGSDAVVIGIAPGIDPNGQYKDYGFSEIWYGSDALRARMEGLYLPNHTNNLMKELVDRVDEGVVDNTYDTDLLPAVRDFSAALANILAPAPPTQSIVVVVVPTSLPQPTAIAQPPAPPPDPRPILAFFGCLLGLAVLGAGGYGFYVWMGTDRKRRAAQRAAQSAKTEIARLIKGWQGENGKKTEADTAIELIGDVDASEVAPLRAMLNQADNQFGRAAEPYAGLVRRTNMEPDNNRLTIAEYAEIERAFARLQPDLVQAYRLVDEVIAEAQQLRKTVGAASTQVADAERAVAEAHDRITEVTEQGFRVEAAIALQKASVQLTIAQSALKTKRFSKAASAAAEAARMADEAADEAEGLPARKKELLDLVAELEGQIKETAKILQTAEGAMEALRAYNPASWADVRGNGEEATNRVEWAQQNFTDMRAAIEEQEFDDAQAEYDQAVTWLSEAKDLVEAISARRAQIEEAKTKVAGAIEQARTSISDATAAVIRSDTLVPEKYETMLQEAAAMLDKLQANVTAEQPDYLGILRLARELDAKADGILAKTQEAAQAIARLKGRVGEQMQEARSSVAAAQKYIGAHEKDVDSGAEKLLASAEASLHAAEAELAKVERGGYEEGALMLAYESVLKMALAADKAADDALSSAKADVKEAENARRVTYAPSYHSTTVVVVDHDDTPSFSGWGSSGQSRPNRTPSGGSSSGTRATRPSSPSPSRPSSSGTRASRPSSPSPSRPSSSGTRARR